MKYLRTTVGGAIHVELADGRLGALYPSGYVRVTFYRDDSRFYPINKRVDEWTEPEYSDYFTKQTFGGENGYMKLYASHKRSQCVLLFDLFERIELLRLFELKNCM